MPILVIVGPDDNPRLLRGLDLGVNDYLARPIEPNEMLARVRTQIRRKRFADRLRDNMQMTMEMAITDGLTGLHNRRYLERHLAALVLQAMARSKPLSALVLDIDHFKTINDTTVMQPATMCLREFSRRSGRRFAASISRADLVARSSSSRCPIPMRRSRYLSANDFDRKLRKSRSVLPTALKRLL